MEIILGVFLGVLILFVVAFFAVRASDRPIRRSEERFDDGLSKYFVDSQVGPNGGDSHGS